MGKEYAQKTTMRRHARAHFTRHTTMPFPISKFEQKKKSNTHQRFEGERSHLVWMRREILTVSADKSKCASARSHLVARAKEGEGEERGESEGWTGWLMHLRDLKL